jgi:hypothetical protein
MQEGWLHGTSEYGRQYMTTVLWPKGGHQPPLHLTARRRVRHLLIRGSKVLDDQKYILNVVNFPFNGYFWWYCRLSLFFTFEQWSNITRHLIYIEALQAPRESTHCLRSDMPISPSLCGEGWQCVSHTQTAEFSSCSSYTVAFIPLPLGIFRDQAATHTR